MMRLLCLVIAVLPALAAGQGAGSFPTHAVRLIVPFAPGGPTDVAAKSAPDGYTMVLGVTGSHAINLSLMKQMPYHPLKDFEPVSQATIFPNAVAVHPSVPAKNLRELVELAKQQPGKLSYGSDGTGTASHLTMELIKAKSGADLVHIPYKGSGPLLNELVGGQVPVAITGPSEPEEFRKFVEDEIQQWAEAVRLSGARAD